MSELKLKIENMTESKHRPRLDELCISAYDLCTSRHLYGGFPGHRCVRAKSRIKVSQILKNPGRVQGEAEILFVVRADAAAVTKDATRAEFSETFDWFPPSDLLQRKCCLTGAFWGSLSAKCAACAAGCFE